MAKTFGKFFLSENGGDNIIYSKNWAIYFSRFKIQNRC